MKFLNKKEQVLDTLLTPHGEKLLADGLFKPEYYAFFDDNVLYEKQYDSGASEPQNNIEPRIQEDTPQLETQVVFSDRNIYRSKTGDAPVVLEEVAQDIDTIIDLTKQNSRFERHFYGPRHPLGTTEKFTSNAPAWSVSLLRGQIDSHADHELNDTEPTLAIAQLDVTLNYNIDVISDPAFVSDTQLAITFPNGEILDVEPEIILAQIKELNTEFTKDNFEIEVFEVTEETVPGGHSLGPKDVEVLRPLKFIRQPSLVQNDILLDEDEIVSVARTPTPDNVEYYFDIRVDGQIDERLICSSVAENEKQGRYIDIDFECEDTTNIALVDIYSTAASSKPCPDLDDPCDDKPGTVY